MEISRRNFLTYLAAYGAVMAFPSCVGKEVAEHGIKVESSYMKDYEKKGTIEELRNHFIKKIKPKMPGLFEKMYNNTVMFGLDLGNDPELLAKIFDKIKKDGNFENVINDDFHIKGEEDITFYNTPHKKYSLNGNFSDLEINLYLETDDKFTKITGMNLRISNLNLDEDRKNHPEVDFKGDFQGDLYGEGSSLLLPYNITGLQYLKIFNFMEADKVDIGGLRTLLTQALNNQDLIQKDLSTIRAYQRGDIELEMSKRKPLITEDVQAFFSVGKKK